MNIEDILNDIEDDITKNEEAARLVLERCDAKRNVINEILSRLDSVKENKNSTYKDAVEAKAHRALYRRL